MDASPAGVVIRPPLPARLWVIGFMVFWVGAVVWTTMIRHHRVSSILVGAAAVAFGITLAYRLVRLGVRSEPDGALTVRNSVGTRRLTRGDIEAFRVSSSGPGWAAQRSVFALLRDGALYRIDVCRGSSAFGRKRSDAGLEQLNRWLHEIP